METLSLNDLLRNAFRILGLTASATQADIDAAARKLRIWQDRSMIPPTANDAAWMGPVPGGRDIEGAVARLADPLTRIEERLWWFCATPPASDTLAPLRNTAGVPELHDVAIRHLYRRLLSGAPADNPLAWESLVRCVRSLSRSDEYLQWLAQAEGAGDFEKSASLDEIVAAQRQMPARLAGALAALMDDVLAADDFGTAAWMVRVVRDNKMSDGPRDVADPAGPMFDRLEDDLTARCKLLSAKIDAAWKTRKVALMRPACNHVIARFNSTIGPMIDEIVPVADEPDRNGRVRGHGAELLIHTARAHEAMSDYLASQRALTTALTLATGTPAEPMVRDLLLKVAPGAQRQRQGAPANRRQGAATSKFQVKPGTYRKDREWQMPGVLRVIAVLLGVVVPALVRMAGTSGTSSSPSRYNSVEPTTPYNFSSPAPYDPNRYSVQPGPRSVAPDATPAPRPYYKNVTPTPSPGGRVR